MHTVSSNLTCGSISIARQTITVWNTLIPCHSVSSNLTRATIFRLLNSLDDVGSNGKAIGPSQNSGNSDFQKKNPVIFSMRYSYKKPETKNKKARLVLEEGDTGYFGVPSTAGVAPCHRTNLTPPTTGVVTSLQNL